MNDSQGDPRIDPFRGKFWKLLKPMQFRPLVKRYLKGNQPTESAAPEPQASVLSSKECSISGISIEPVRTTAIDFTRPRSIPIFRPPGAVEETQFLAGCTRCNDCSAACPHQAIRPVSSRMNRLAGTPTIEADIAACLMCKDFPCIAACKPGVLTNQIPVIIGTAMITAHLCLAHHGTTCTICSERCPVEGAISVRDGKPSINEDACTGCGVCRYVCPAPENAILLMPLFSRPLLPA
jgi:MauM/NapG family ferredoxin protein